MSIRLSLLLLLTTPVHAAAPPLPRMTYLDNGQVRVGCDLTMGGAVTYLVPPGRPNMVNSWDLGRQVQMSYYSGPSPLVINGQRPAPMWAGLGWNPVQAGDHYGHRSRLLAYSNDGKTIYTKSVPMLWPHDGIAAECTFETWLSLDGAAVRLRARLSNHRGDRTLYPARDQEMPAVYLNGPYHRLLAYTGDRPFTGGALTRIVKRRGTPGPWTYFRATESWAALLDDDDFGVGVWQPACQRFVGGFAGRPGKGGPRDTATGYVAPIAHALLDHNARHEYECTLIVGTLPAIRRYIATRSTPPRPPVYRFRDDRQGWTHTGVTEAGWPIRGELRLTVTGAAELLGPDGFWYAKEAPQLRVEMAAATKAKQCVCTGRRTTRRRSTRDGASHSTSKAMANIARTRCRWRGRSATGERWCDYGSIRSSAGRKATQCACGRLGLPPESRAARCVRDDSISAAMIAAMASDGAFDPAEVAPCSAAASFLSKRILNNALRQNTSSR